MNRKTKISINDVLIDHHSHKLKFAYSHVGNRRFVVMLQIYRKQFLQELKKGNEEECRKILVNIVQTVCHKIIPNGRFLEYNVKCHMW